MTKHYCGATKKRRNSNPSGNKSGLKLPNFATLAFGSLIGIVLTSLAFYVFTTSNITLEIPVGSLAENKAEAEAAAAVTEAKTTPASATPEPRFDFYTELTQSSQDTNPSTPPPPATTPVSKQVTMDLKSKTKAINAYSVQAGSFKNRADADSLRATLMLNGLDVRVEAAKLADGIIWHRVMIGPFANEKNAKTVLQSLKQQDVDGMLVVKYAE